MAGDTWDGGWEADRRRKARAWASLTPEQLLEWLEDVLDLAAASGTLAHDRHLRHVEARRAWEAGAGRDDHGDDVTARG